MAVGLTRRVGIVALGRAANAAGLLAVNAVLVRYWDAAEIGYWLAVWLVVNALVPLFTLGLPTALLYYYPRLKEIERTQLIVQSLVCLGGGAGLLAVGLWYWEALSGGWAGGWTGDRGWGPGLGVYLRPFLPYVFFLVIGGFIEAVLVASGKAHWQAALSLAGAAALVGLAWFGGTQGWAVAEVLQAFGVWGALRLLAGVGLVAAGARWSRASWSLAHLRQRLGYARTIWLNDVLGSASRSVDGLVVLTFFAAGTFGGYRLGSIEVPVGLLLGATVTVLVPEVSRLYGQGQLAEIGALWRRTVARLGLVILPLFFFLFVNATPLIAVLYTASYEYTGWVFRVFLLALPLRVAVYNPLLVGMGKARWALWGSIADLGLNLALSLALVWVLQDRWPGWAFLGPAVATVLSTYVQVVFLVGIIARHLRWGAGQLLPWADLGRIAACSAAAAAVSWAGGAYAAALDLPAWGRVGMGAAGFGGGFLVLAWVSPGIRQRFAGLWQGLKGG